MLGPSDERSEPSAEGLLPPRAPAWLRASVSGSFSAAIFLVPGFLAFLAPVPLLIAFRRHGSAVALAAAGVGTVTVPLLAAISRMGLEADATQLGLLGQPGYVVAGLFVVLAALPAALLAWAFRRTGGGIGALELGSVVYLVVLAVGICLVATTVNGGVLGLATRWVAGSLDTVTEVWRDQSPNDEQVTDALAELSDRRAWYLRWGVRLLPSVLISLVVGALWLNVVYSRWFTGGENENDDLTLWKLPMGVMYGFMGCTAVVVLQVGPLGSIFPRSDPLLVGAANGLIVLSMLYWLQGIAVTNYYFLRLRIGPFTRMFGVGAQALLMIKPATSVLFGATGLADAWFDLRRLEGSAPTETGEET